MLVILGVLIVLAIIAYAILTAYFADRMLKVVIEYLDGKPVDVSLLKTVLVVLFFPLSLVLLIVILVMAILFGVIAESFKYIDKKFSKTITLKRTNKD